MTSNNTPENLLVKSSSSDEPELELTQTAGELLRRAREERGIDLATLAAVLKVSEQKLQALEANDFGKLPEMAFTRGLAKSICKRLEIDEKPILALLPELHSAKPSDFAVDLTKPMQLNTMRENFDRSRRFGVLWLLVGLVIAAALFFYFMPADWKSKLFSGGAGESESTSLQAPNGDDSATTRTTTLIAPALTVPASEPVSAVPETQQTADASTLTERDVSDEVQGSEDASQEDVLVDPVPAPEPQEIYFIAKGGSSSITIKGNDGKVILTRTLRDGQEASVSLDQLPIKVNVGNVKATTVKLRGQEFDLQPHAKRNTANFEVN